MIHRMHRFAWIDGQRTDAIAWPLFRPFPPPSPLLPPSLPPSLARARARKVFKLLQLTSKDNAFTELFEEMLYTSDMADYLTLLKLTTATA